MLLAKTIMIYVFVAFFGLGAFCCFIGVFTGRSHSERSSAGVTAFGCLIMALLFGSFLLDDERRFFLTRDINIITEEKETSND